MSIDFKNVYLYEMTRYLIIGLGEDVEEDVVMEYKESDDGQIYLEIYFRNNSMALLPSSDKILVIDDNRNIPNLDLMYCQNLAENNPKSDCRFVDTIDDVINIIKESL